MTAYSSSRSFHSAGAFLRYKLQNARSKNTMMSLRAFAKHLGLAHSTLSQVISEKKSLSPKTALTIVKRLRLNANETAHFMTLVQLSPLKGTSEQDPIVDHLRNKHQALSSAPLAEADYSLLSDDDAFFIIELISTYGSTWGYEQISKHLSIPKGRVEQTLEELQSRGIIRKTKSGYERSSAPLVANAARSRKILLAYHRRAILRLLGAVEFKPKTERILRTGVFAFDQENHAYVKELIEEMFAAMQRSSAGRNQPNATYQMIVGLTKVSRSKDQEKGSSR